MYRPTTASPESPQSQLRHFVEAVSSELQLEPLLARIVECACQLAGADEGLIELHDARHGTIGSGLAHCTTRGDRGAPKPLGQILAGRILASGLPVDTRLADLGPIDPAEFADHWVIAIPILWRGEPVGCLAVVASPPSPFSDETRELLGLFARHVGIAIENARRYERARRRTARFELVARVARIINAGADLNSMLQQTADAIHDVLEFPNVDIPLLDPNDPNVLVVAVRGGGYKRKIRGVDRLPIDRGVMGAAVRERRTQRVDDVRSDGRYITPPTTEHACAELAVPIIVSGEVVGVVNVEGERAYDELDQRTIEIIADHVGVAIRNARLHELNRVAAVWQERSRLRSELHDSVTQILSSISLLAQALPSAWRRSQTDGERRAQRLAELAQTAFSEMRALLRELQPPGESGPHISQRSRSFLGLERLREGGLGAALPRLLDAMIPESLSRSYHLDDYMPQHLAHEEAMYRVCQEAISNVIRHSGAREIVVTAHTGPTEVSLSVRDDGTGLPPDVRGGIGLGSMRDRVARLGGTLSLYPASPRGLEVRVCLPRRDRQLEQPWTTNPSD